MTLVGNDFGLCQKIRILEFLGFEQEEIKGRSKYPEQTRFLHNCLYLARTKRMDALSEPWILDDTGRVFSSSVAEELEYFAEVEGKISGLDYVQPIDGPVTLPSGMVSGAEALEGLKGAVKESRDKNKDLTVETAMVYLIREREFGRKEVFDHCLRHGLAKDIRDIDLADSLLKRHYLI